MLIKSIKLFLLACSFLFCTLFCFAQDLEQLEYNFVQENESVDSSIKELTVIDFCHEYNLNPHTAAYNSEAQILTSVYEGLYSYDPVTLDPVEALAVDYKVSRNKLRWTFKIRENAHFSDGSVILAKDIRRSWLDLLANPDASFSSMLDCISGAKEYRTGNGNRDKVGIIARDNNTLVVELNAPAAYLQRLLCHHSFSVLSEKKDVVSGAYTIKSYENGVMILSKNTNYWDSENVKLDTITIVQNDDADENSHKYNTGKVDWISGNVTIAKLLNRNSINVSAEFGTQYLFFKGNRTPLDDADVRLALLAAVPWNVLRSNQIVPADTLVYPIAQYPIVEGFNDTDVDEAISLMKKAKKKVGVDENKDLEIVFAIDDSDYMMKEYEILAEAWKPLGVKLLPQKTSAADYLANISSWNADIFAYTWIGDFADPFAFLELFREGSKLKESKWVNPKYDELLDKAMLENDTAQRYKFFAQAEQVLLDDGVIIPISHPVSMNIIDRSIVGGWSSNALDLHPLKYLYFKKVPVKVQNLVYAK